jgi:hypothetical protein
MFSWLLMFHPLLSISRLTKYSTKRLFRVISENSWEFRVATYVKRETNREFLFICCLLCRRWRFGNYGNYAELIGVAFDDTKKCHKCECELTYMKKKIKDFFFIFLLKLFSPSKFRCWWWWFKNSYFFQYPIKYVINS